MVLNLAILIVFLLFLIFSISKWNIHPFVALIITALGLGLASGIGGQQTVDVLLKGFSETLRWIAIIIILGAFIGEVLQENGSAFRIADKIVKWAGEKKLPWAMGITGYIVSIPVFIDVAYILLQPVVESLSVKSKRPVLYIGFSLIAGLLVSHTLIPPTPGPMAVASLLNLDIGRMLGINLFVGIFALIGGVSWIIYIRKKLWIQYDDKLVESIIVEDEIMSNNLINSGHNFLYDILPIVAPIILIGLGSFLKLEKGSIVDEILTFVTLPLVAVLIGAIIAAFQIRSKNKKSKLNVMVEQAIIKSALVIMITGAGGSLGYVIKESGIQNEIVHVFSDFPFLGILLPFIVASILTISTGSITVSLVGSASMLGPMIGNLAISPEIVAASIGCGSLCVIHANSSLFWLLNRLHEVPPKLLYRSLTVQSLVMGFTGLMGLLILKWIGF